MIMLQGMKPVYQGFVEKQMEQMAVQAAGQAVSSATKMGLQQTNGKLKQL